MRGARARRLAGLGLGEGAAVRFAPGLYDGHVPELLALVRGIGEGGVSRVLVVGHNPAISDAGRYLAREGDPALLSRLALGHADLRARGAEVRRRGLERGRRRRAHPGSSAPADYPEAD